MRSADRPRRCGRSHYPQSGGRGARRLSRLSRAAPGHPPRVYHRRAAKLCSDPSARRSRCRTYRLCHRRPSACLSQGRFRPYRGGAGAREFPASCQQSAARADHLPFAARGHAHADKLPVGVIDLFKENAVAEGYRVVYGVGDMIRARYITLNVAETISGTASRSAQSSSSTGPSSA